MPLDYEGLYREEYRRNVRDVRRAVRDRRLDEKIDNFCDLHGFQRDDVIEQINHNNVVAACFAVNPNRQNIYENIAARFIKDIDGVSEFEMLPTDRLVVVDGALIKKNDLRRAGGQAKAKTVDFKWQYAGLAFYASHKYTKETGGSQDNQYKDLQFFIAQCNPTILQNTHFIAIADGAYYQGRDGQAGVSRIDRLKQLASGDKVHACTICDLEALMQEIAR